MKTQPILFLLIILIGLLCSTTMKSQSTLPFCGTETTDELWLKEYQKHPDSFEKTEEMLFVALSIHVVDKSDTILFSEAEILSALCLLNEDFAPAKIHFFIKGDIHFIVDSTYANHNISEGFQMMNQYNVDSTINCYIVDNPSGYCGYSTPVGISIRKTCMTYGQRTWAHEIGHHLSLPHTFRGWYNINYNPNEPTSTQINGEPEMVNGSNCETAGDGFCDTPPDYISHRWSCKEDQLSELKQTDPNGETFYSDGSLIMSYSHCMSRFSEEQNEAMRNNLKGPHELYLYDETEIPPFFDDAEVKLISPIDNQSVVNTIEGVSLSWETTPNAEFYVVQINPLYPFSNYYATEYASFNRIKIELITKDSFFTISKLDEDLDFFLSENYDYLWRVRAYQGFANCTSFSDIEQFHVISPFYKNSRFDWTEFLDIYPNPFLSASDLTIKYTLRKNSSIQLALLDVTGKLLLKQELEWLEGENFHLLSLPILPNGLYFLNLIMDKEQVSKKFIINGN